MPLRPCLGCQRGLNVSTQPPLDDVIRDAAQKPSSVSGDAGSVTQRSLTELIEADRYLASKEAAKSKFRGLRLSKLIPPGTVSWGSGK